MILGIGVDIIEVDRIHKAIKRWGKSFLSHVFTPEVIEYAKKNKFPTQHFAARFAAKEAVFKAMADDSITWKDIKILNDKRGKPYCIFRGKNHKKKILLSIAHTKKYAVASAIITK